MKKKNIFILIVLIFIYGISFGQAKDRSLPIINTQPIDQTDICPESEIDFSISGEDIDTYQWQESTDGGNNFSDLQENSQYSGTQTDILTITDTNMNNYLYRCMATNSNGSVASNSALLSLETEIPVLNVTDLSVELNEEGFYLLNSNDVIESISDNCEIADTIFGQSYFYCEDVGEFNLEITVTDLSGNENTQIVVLDIADNTNPTVVTQDIEIEVDENGDANILPDDIDNGSFDNCQIVDLNLSQTDFDEEDLGENSIYLTAIDDSFNSSEGVAIVTVTDNTVPTILTQNITIELDENGYVSILPDDIDNGSFDNCGIESLSLDISDFDCGSVGENIVTLTVVDYSNNSASEEAVVSVIDNLSPTVTTQNLMLELNEEGFVSIDEDDIHVSSYDNCDIQNISLDISDFDCSDIGINTVSLTVTDAYNNSTVETATVTIEDNIFPILIPEDITIDLDDNGLLELSPYDLIVYYEDNCEIEDISLDITELSCEDIGENELTITMTDLSGNTVVETVFVIIEDNTPPEVIVQDITLDLDENGYASITSSDINNGSTDNCGISEINLNISEFNCDNIGDNIVILNMSDNYDNTSSDTAVVSVQDILLPEVLCPNNITFVADSITETYTVQTNELDLISLSDNCDIGNIENNINSNMSLEGEIFEVGTTTITWTVYDISENYSECSFELQIDNPDSYEVVNNIYIPEINIFPNPSNGLFTINHNSKEYSKLIVMNNVGKTILNKNISGNYTNIDLSKQSNGIYFVRLMNNKNPVYMKIVKQ